MEKEKQGVSLGVVMILAVVGLFMGILAYLYFKDLSANKLVTGFELNLKSIKQNENIKNESDADKGNLEIFLDKIFVGNGIYQDAIPEFNDINSVNKDWIYSVIYNNFVEQGKLNKIVKYDEIQKELFSVVGNNSNLNFPEEGTSRIKRIEGQNNEYQILESQDKKESFQGYIISNVSFIEGKYIATINEFKYQLSEDGQTYIFTDKYGKAIKTYPSSYENSDDWSNNKNEMKDYVSKNIDRFTMKEVTIGKNNETGNMYIISVKVK